jgi:rhomboid protease GluP
MMATGERRARSWYPSLLVLCPTILLTAGAAREPAVFLALRRDPQALAAGQLWRLLSPVLVQADALEPGGWWRTGAVWLLVAAALAAGERVFGFGRTLGLYGLGALVGHGVGLLWQPYSAGCSVAGCGVLGALALWVLLRARVLQLKLGASLVLALGVVTTLLRDIHGPPLLSGALLALWCARRQRRFG